jgi:hypothetical protein
MDNRFSILAAGNGICCNLCGSAGVAIGGWGILIES